MEVKVSGYENNRPVVSTYEISEEALGVAIADGKGWFRIEVSVDTEKVYGLLQNSRFIGLVCFFEDPCRAMLATFTDNQEITIPESQFSIHTATQTNQQPDN